MAMKKFLKKFTTFVLVWTVGVVIFDLALGLQGSMMMLAGAVTYVVADFAHTALDARSKMTRGSDYIEPIHTMLIHSETENPTEPGWYECWANDDRFRGEKVYRAWKDGRWAGKKDKWYFVPCGVYLWRGPVADINGPSPDGTPSPEWGTP